MPPPMHTGPHFVGQDPRCSSCHRKPCVGQVPGQTGPWGHKQGAGDGGCRISKGKQARGGVQIQGGEGLGRPGLSTDNMLGRPRSAGSLLHRLPRAQPGLESRDEEGSQSQAGRVGAAGPEPGPSGVPQPAGPPWRKPLFSSERVAAVASQPTSPEPRPHGPRAPKPQSPGCGQS